jgi:hypothetical protein
LAKKEEKKIIDVEITTLYLDGYKATELVSYLNDYIAEYGDTVYIDMSYGSHGSSDTYTLKYKRLENGEEFAKRIMAEAQQMEAYEERQRKVYEQLKAKYG